MWSYKITSGEIAENGQIRGSGYSGFGDGKNNPASVAIPDIGPIPPGKYRIGPAFDDPGGKGPCVMRLEPLPGTDVFGRSGFMIHGDSLAHPGEASHGCIVLGPQIRQAINASRDRILEVNP